VYVLDWGLAKLVGATSDLAVAAEAAAPQAGAAEIGSGETSAGLVLGTPGYMAPEQIGAAHEADDRSDVYALGAILFEILAGEPLHPGRTVVELVRSTQALEAGRPSERKPDADTPPELDALCARATALAAANRLASARELAEAIDRWLEGDRDLEARRTLAAHHAAQATQATARALAGGAAGHRERGRALREAGRALALDPSSPEALAVTAKLLLEPPADLPAAVRRDIEDAAVQAMRHRGRVGAIVFGFFTVLLATFPWTLGVRSWTGFWVITASTAATTLLGAIAALRRLPFARRRAILLLATAFAFLAIAATSWLSTPLVLVPAFVIGLASTTMADGLQGSVRHYVVMGIAAVLAPVALEWAGALPAVDVRPEGILLRSLVLGRMPPEWLLLLATVVTFLGASVSIWLSVRGQALLRERWLLQLWHLREMTTVEHSMR
jgi:serine/threonine-protein kinase